MNQCKIISFICLFVLLLYSCKESQKNRIQSANSSETDELTLALDNRLMEMRKHLMYKRISSLDQIVNNNFNDGEDDRSIVVSYSGADCSACIGASFALINSLHAETKKRVFVIAISTSVGSDQLLYNYDQMIYNDTHDWLRKELKYYYTPVFFIVNRYNVIKDAFFVTSYRDTKKQADDFKKFLVSNGMAE